MPKNSSDSSKIHNCDRIARHPSVIDQKYIKPRRVIASKKAFPADGRSFSTGKLDPKPASPRSKKSSKSDSVVTKKEQHKLCPGCCHKCGDSFNQEEPFNRFCNTSRATPSQNKKLSIKIACSGVQQYYRNENFQESSGSIREAKTPRQPALDPINETPEKSTTHDSGEIVILTESSDSDGCIDFEDHKSLMEIKRFREKYFFECHNSKSRVYKNKCGSKNSDNHKCVYRFYLNDRLFPVPLCTDHNNSIRCVECHLPLEERGESAEINGTIQAKVKIDDDEEAQDMTLFLPVKDSLIVREKRLDKNKQNEEILYFGVVKLNRDGDSMFEPNAPSNSLALRYQKGYKELKKIDNLVYGPSDNGKVIIL
ncbi:hypothetical protein JYU34_011741 [Plutella xylostella]|uniref:Uncharacterized protein n=1 Tax=Plutella xylostella TaxID=51655 RepID=A0ABQ7QEE0_PLUXY|nr:hypothetical protein JYU34_011741 [Plutella xylostella]